MAAATENRPTPAAPRARRDIITPHAFRMDQRLLGLPLAQPWRRAVALAIDGLAVAVLSEVQGALLACVTGLVMLRWASRTQHVKVLRWRGWLRATAIVLAVTGAIGVVRDVRVLSSGMHAATDTAQITEEPSHPPALADVEVRLPETGESVRGLVAWTREVLDDLGIGLGWAALYFTVFPAWWNGQTPGKKLLGIRVVAARRHADHAVGGLRALRWLRRGGGDGPARLPAGVLGCEPAGHPRQDRRDRRDPGRPARGCGTRHPVEKGVRLQFSRDAVRIVVPHAENCSLTPFSPFSTRASAPGSGRAGRRGPPASSRIRG